MTVRLGTNTLLGLDPVAIRTVSTAPTGPRRPQIPAWDGYAAERVALVVADFLAGV